MDHDAVVLLQMGGPERLEGVRPFLEALLGDPAVVRLPWPMRAIQPAFARAVAARRAPKVRPRYEAIGGGDGRASPIGDLTRRQAEALSARLGVPVHVAMRYTRPGAAEAVQALQEQGARKVLLLPLYPQWSGPTTGSSLQDFARAASGLDAQFCFVRSWADHPAYVDAVAQCVEEVPGPGPVLFSAHSLPVAYVRRGDPYEKEVRSSLEALKGRLGRTDLILGFQSAVGPGRWLGPETEEHLQALAQLGHEEVALAPLGFVTDHIETLYDLDTKYRQQAESLGLRMRRVPSLNDRPAFIEALAQVCQGPTEAFEVKAWT